MNSPLTKRLIVLILLLTSLSAYAEQANKAEQLKHAISLRKNGDYHQAVNILNKLISGYSDHKRINIELTLNYIRLQQFEQAEQLLHHVQTLSLTDKEQSTVNKLNRILERKLRKSLSVHSYTLDIGLAYGIDIASNIYPVFVYEDYQDSDEYWYEDESFDDYSVEQDYNFIEYTDLETVQDREEVTEKTEVNYHRQFINLDYRYRPNEQFQFLNSATQWIIDTEFTIDHRKLNDDNGKNYLNYEIDSSLYLIQINHWMVEFNLKNNLYENNGKKVMNKLKAGIKTTVPFNRLRLKLAWDYQQKSYQQQLAEYNASISIPWAELSYSFFNQLKFIAGIKYSQLKANDPIHSYDNTNLYTGIYYSPRININTYLTYHRNKLSYLIDGFDEVNWSREKNQTIAFGVKYQISDQWSLNVNGNIGNHTIELGYGENNWKRIDASVVYRF